MAKAKTKNNLVLTARDMLNGYVAGSADYNIYNMTPLQMVPEKEKDEDWKKWNLDWLERAGINQLSCTSRKIVKNYYLANGIIDKSDYIIGDGNDMNEQLSLIAPNMDEAIPIKFFPLVPNVINLLTGEFSKRDQRIIVTAVDDISRQEAYEYKKDLLTQILVQNAQAKKQKELLAMGVEFDTQDPEQQQQIQSEMDMAKQMAEAEVKFKSYRGIAEQWANHMMVRDNERFDMYQLENRGFRDMLVSDREFWHIRVKDDDYEVELWEPWTTFYHKSPSVEYISDGNYVGRIRMMSLPDVIDMYGWRMTDEQIMSLKEQYKSLNNFPLVVDGMKDQENWYTDFSKPYPQNYTNVTWQKWLDGKAADFLSGKYKGHESNVAWFDIDNYSKYYTQEMDLTGPGMVRVTEGYWKSQRKLFELTWIREDGVLVNDVVDESYIVTYPPEYNTSINKVKSKANLIKGEHLDAIWINEVRGGVKINTSLTARYTRNYSDFEPVYIGGDPIPFQFKGQTNLYGCKLPVEGRIFSERGSASSSLVDKMKSNQINFNIINNQIVEMLADNVGKVLVIDPNGIPRNSLGGEWGKHNYGMFHQIMKDYQIAPIDSSMRNTESPTNFAHFQMVDLSKAQELMTHIQLADYFKREAFSVVGITPERLGSVAASMTATGVQQATNNSYAQTEPYFDQHMNHLMPRVRQMMIDAAQFINATKPESHIAYLNKDEENIWFQIEGHRLLLRDFCVHSKSTADIKELKTKLEQLAMQTIPAGGSLVDAARILSMTSPSEIIEKLAQAEEKRNQDIQAQRQHEQEMQQQQQQFMEAQEEKALAHEDKWKERELDTKIYIEEIRAVGYARELDINANQIPDPLEVQSFLHQQNVDASNQIVKIEELRQQRKKIDNDAENDRENRKIAQEEMKSRERIEKMKLKNPVSGEKPPKK